NDRFHARFRPVEQVHLDPGGDCARELDDLLRRKSGHVAIHRDHRARRREEVGRGRALRHEGRRARPFSEQIVPRFPPSLRDKSFRDDDAAFPCADETLSPDERFVPWVRSGDRHVIRWIAATNFPQPCQRGSAVGIPYFCSYVPTTASTSSRVMFSWLIPMPTTFPPPMRRV